MNNPEIGARNMAAAEAPASVVPETSASGQFDIVEIFFILLHRLWLIILVGIVCGAAAFGIAKATIVPMYRSNSSISLLSAATSASSDESLSSSQISASTMLTKDYEVVISSRNVVEAVFEDPDINPDVLDMSVAELTRRISVENPSNTRILKISVVDEDPLNAQIIVDSLTRISAQKIVDLLGIAKVTIIDTGNLPSSPYNDDSLRIGAAAAVIGALITAIAVVVVYYLDDKVTTPDDVERYLGVSVLGSIPDIALAEKADNKRLANNRRRARANSGRSRRHSDSSDSSDETASEE